MSSIADRLRAARDRTSRAEFAPTLGISPATLQRYERGDRSPDAGVLQKLCLVHGISPSWILNGEGPMYRAGNATSPIRSGYSLSENALRRHGAMFELLRSIRTSASPPSDAVLRLCSLLVVQNEAAGDALRDLEERAATIFAYIKGSSPATEGSEGQRSEAPEAVIPLGEGDQIRASLQTPGNPR